MVLKTPYKILSTLSLQRFLHLKNCQIQFLIVSLCVFLTDFPVCEQQPLRFTASDFCLETCQLCDVLHEPRAVDSAQKTAPLIYWLPAHCNNSY